VALTHRNDGSIHCGIFKKMSIKDRIDAKAKSAGSRIADVQSGLYNAANKMPTTAAFIPV